MKEKFKLLLFIAMMFSLPLVFLNKASAIEIKDDGQYALVMVPSSEGATIEGLPSKVVKFNFGEKEDTVSSAELIKETVAFNGKTKFSKWTMDESGKQDVGETFKKGDFNIESGKMGDVSYTNGLRIYAQFSNEGLKGKYYLRLDPFGGQIKGSNAILTMESNIDEFKTVDLSTYKAEREGCTFCGWDYNGALISSVDKSYFSESDFVVTVSAVYKSNIFCGLDKDGNKKGTSEPSRVLTLNANGGTIEGEDSKQYDYLQGADSSTDMKIFQYVPEREGYKFEGWNSNNKGLGKDCKYLNRMDWSNAEYDIETLPDSDYNGYLTLYARWTKLSDTTTEEDVKDVSTGSDSEVKGSIQFEKGINRDYKLDVKGVEVSEELANKNVKFMLDINLLDGNSQVFKIDDNKMKIKIEVPEDLRGYQYYKVAYIENGEIKEILPAVIDEDGYVIFETTHLSQYGIIATNDSDEIQSGEGLEGDSDGELEDTPEDELKQLIDNPTTGDGITFATILLAVSSMGIGALPVLNKRKIK